jgi:hypothetical protein
MAVDSLALQTHSETTVSSFAVLPTPGMLMSYPFLKVEDPLEGSMLVETSSPAWLHRSWTVMDWHKNTMTCFYVPRGTATTLAYGALDGAMPINQFPAGFKLCRYTAYGQTPWDFADTENDGFFRHCQVM